MKQLSRCAVVICICVSLWPALVAAQQEYPNKPIRVIVPFAPGGSTTILARIFGQKLTESWGQQVIVDSRGGGNTVIGTEAVAKAPPDGYTLLFKGNSQVINSLLFSNIPYDPIKDFAPVATFCVQQFVLVLSPSVPANTLQELIALAKAKPGQLNYASPGSGGIQHLAGELLSMSAGIKMQHIPYKGSGPLIPDLMAGQVQMSFQSPSVAVPNVKAGRLKGVAVTGEQRMSALPQVPTFSQAGLPEITANTWFGIFAPAGTPREVINKLSVEIEKILAMTGTRDMLAGQGVEALPGTPEQFAALMRADKVKWDKVIKSANIKIEN